MDEKPLESWRARAHVAEALDVFNSPYMQDVWAKALSRLRTDPEAAVTSARTLLESVCKHILEAAGSEGEVREGTPLPQLYKQTAKVLDIAPSDNLAPVFNTMFTACTEVIKGVGSLRNELSEPTTIRKEFSLLKVALGGRSAAAFAEADKILKKRNLLSNVWVPAKKRVSQKDVETLLQHFREEAPGIREDRLNKGTAAGMADIVEFTLWSGRQQTESLSLRWGDVNFKKHTCKLPEEDHAFPVLERAWEIIEERRSDTHKPDDRIFPFRKEAISMRHKFTINGLYDAGKIAYKIRFHDYRYEAVYRLLEKGYPLVLVGQATGQKPDKIHKIAEELHAQAQPA